MSSAVAGLGVMAALFVGPTLARAQQPAGVAADSPAQDARPELTLRARSELTIEASANGVDFTVSGALRDDRGTAVDRAEVLVELHANDERVVWHAWLMTDAVGRFATTSTVEDDGEYTLRAQWQGAGFVDGATVERPLTLRRAEPNWEYRSTLLVPASSSSTVNPMPERPATPDATDLGAFAVLRWRGGADETVSTSGSCIERGLFVAASSQGRDPGTPALRRDVTSPESEPPGVGVSSEESVLAAATEKDTLVVYARRGTAPFVEPCEMLLSTVGSSRFRAAVASITVLPLPRIPALENRRISDGWSRQPRYQLSVDTDPAVVHDREVLLSLYDVDADSAIGSPALWNPTDRETSLGELTLDADEVLRVRAVHLDAAGRPIWSTASAQVGGHSIRRSLKGGLLIGFVAVMALAVAELFRRRLRNFLMTRRPSAPQSDHAPPPPIHAPAPRLSEVDAVTRWIDAREATTGWAIRDAFVVLPSTNERRTADAQQPGRIFMREDLVGETLRCGASGYFETEFCYDRATMTIELQPAREVVKERVEAIFRIAEIPVLADLSGWGRAEPRAVLFGAIRKRFPLWTDRHGFEHSAIPLAAVRDALAATGDASRLAQGDLLALAALILETALFSPSTPADVPQLLSAIERRMREDG